MSATKPAPSAPAGRARARWDALIGGGPEGNEQLTGRNGALLIVLLAVIGITILRLRQLISVHLFVGLVLLGPVAVKMVSTGYRFARYYMRDRAYQAKGPPELVMRLSAPIVVVSTVVVFVSGIVLLADGPSSRNEWLPIHKISFIVWLAFMALHVLGHLPGVASSLRVDREALPGLQGGASGRWLALGGALIAGLVIALVLLPDFGAWTTANALGHHH